MAKRGKFYVVWEGVEPGVYDSWEEAQEQVTNYPGAKYKSFNTQEEAIAAYRNGSSDNLDILVNLVSRQARIVDYSVFPEIELDAMAVDASCLGNPGVMEYQGVDVKTGTKIFRVGPFQDATNNIGEYLAIVHALAMTAQQGIVRTIYSDSKTAIAWVRNRRANTKLAPTQRNAKVIELIARADRWLQTHTWQNRILKWNTEVWGEIPADFGRK
ncbi:MAG: ribonuclease H [Bacteroidales bacterium]|nr:ribonuclease H [Bacteroidales bacterium]